MGSVLFFDIKSFYANIGLFVSDGDKNRITRLLGIVEPYMPIVVSDENIDTFLEAAMRNDADEVQRLESQFISNSKIKFIRSLSENGDDEWLNTVDTCQTIRRYKIEGIQFTM
jgi:hypothetical protein